MASPGLSRIPGTSGSPGLSSIPIGGTGPITSGSVGIDTEDAGKRDILYQQIRRSLIARGMSPSAASASAKLHAYRKAEEINRPVPLLSAIGRAFKAIESTSAGFAQGIAKSAEKPGFNPIADVAAGVKNIPKAVGDEYGWGEFVKQEVVTDPTKSAGKFAYDHAGAIGFSLALVTDPTMYVSFGATSASKIAASRLLAEGANTSIKQAQNVIAKKGGMYWGTKYTDPTELAMKIHQVEGRPFTLPQTLDSMRGIGLARKAAERGGSAGLRKRITGYVLPLNVKGGRGIRLGGAEILGTSALGEKVGRGTRAIFQKSSEKGVGSLNTLQRSFVTMSESRTIADDMIRAMVMLERTHLTADLADLERTSKNFGQMLARIPHAQDLPSVEPLVDPSVLKAKPHMGRIVGFYDSKTGELKLGKPGQDHGSLDDMSSYNLEDILELNINLDEGGHIGAINAEKSIKSSEGDWYEFAKASPEDVEIVGQRVREELYGRVSPTVDTSIIKGTERASAMGIGAARTPRAQSLKDQVNTTIEREIAKAKKVGLTRNSRENLWHKVAQETADPIEAAVHFVWRNQTQVLGRQSIERILDNPMFAEKVSKKAAVRNLKPSHVPFTDHRGQRWGVLHGLEAGLEALKNPLTMDREMNQFIRMLNVPQNFWKAFATSPNPSFHVMNAFGAIFNNLFDNVYNPGDYVKAFATVMRAKLMEAGDQGQDKYLGMSTAPTAARKEAKGVYEAGQTRGALSSVGFFADLRDEAGGFQKLIHDQPISAKEKLIATVKPVTGQSKKRYAAQKTRQAVGTFGIATGNPLIAAAGFAPEIITIGKKVGGTVEDTVRLAPFMKAAKDPDTIKWLEAYGPIRVAGNTHPGYTKAQQKVMYDIGADIAKYFQFDYSDLTTIERRFAKTIFPFYTYYRKNFVFQAQQLAKAPRGIDVPLKVAQYMNDNGDLPAAMQDLLPEYFDNLGALQVPVPGDVRKKLGLPENDALFLNPKLPFLALNLFPPLWDVFRNTGQPAHQKIMATFAPVAASVGPLAVVPGAKIMLESVAGYSFGLNKPLDYQRSSSGDWRNSFVPAPGWVKYIPEPMRDFLGIFPYGDIVKTREGQYMMTATGQYILDQLSTPFITNLGKSLPTGGDELSQQKARADMVSWMSGVRLMPVDTLQMHRSWAYRMRSMLNGRQQELKDVGEDLEPEDRRTLRQLENIIDTLERAWDRREAEMYGEEK